MTRSDYDIIIVGGGMVGATLAYALCCETETSSDLKVAIVEQADADLSVSPSFDARAIALAYGSAELLKKYGLWRELAQFSQKISHIHVSDKGFPGKVRITDAELAVDALGYVIEVDAIGRHVIARLAECDNVDWFQPDEVEGLTNYSDHVSVQLRSGQQLSAPLILGCDGANSRVRQLAKIEQTREQYQQHAVIATVQTDQPHQARAFERFTETGPLALLPLSDNRLSLVWTVTDDHVEAISQLDDAAFLQTLQQRFGYQLGQFIKVGTRTVYPLHLVRAKQIIAHRCALVGNACHTIHPIAGQGYNLGLRDVDEIVSLIRAEKARNGDIGRYAVLRQYQASRGADHNRVITMTDGLVRMFSNQYPALVMGRNLALMAINNSGILNTLLAEQAMGLNHRSSDATV